MKNKWIFLLGMFFLTADFSASAQDSSRSAAKKINKTGEQGENLHGKKIQQQTLSNNRVEKLDTIAAKPTKKKAVKHTHKSSQQKKRPL